MILGHDIACKVIFTRRCNCRLLNIKAVLIDILECSGYNCVRKYGGYEHESRRNNLQTSDRKELIAG